MSGKFLTRVQQQKYTTLVEEQQGRVIGITYHIKLPDGSIAFLDPWGRVIWKNSHEKEKTSA